MRGRNRSVRVKVVRSAGEVTVARRLIRTYGRSLGVDLGFQQFDRELRDLPGEYRPPSGELWLAWRGDRAVGCVALRSLDRRRGEMKRLYVLPSERGRGLGRRLARIVVRSAARRGYRWVYLDTLATMTPALGLYADLGFRRIGPYRPNPIPGSRFLRLRLDRPRPRPSGPERTSKAESRSRRKDRLRSTPVAGSARSGGGRNRGRDLPVRAT
ncbi:MAG: GNAT family N-acetyltransferase [Thermoplasmata archaeon]